MIKRIITLVIVLLSFQCNSQELSDFNIGIGIPFFNNTDGSRGEFSISKTPGIYLEKPFAIEFLNIKSLTLNPGISFRAISESGKWGGMGGGGQKNLTHRSLSGYIKIIQKNNIEKTIPSTWYVGVISGIHIITQTTGSANSYSMFNPQANWSIPDYKTDANDFYPSIYFGLVAGIEPASNIKSRIRPALEIRILPHYATPKIQFEKYFANPIEIAIQFGINTKKSIQKNN